MKNVSYGIIMFVIIFLWSSNIILLNTISKREKEYAGKRKISQDIIRNYEKVVLEYDDIVDLEKIRRELLAKGFKQTRDIIYFEVEKDNAPDK
ncbi:MAG: hypothetical protein ACRCZ9_02065 [Fusobacteriaceae bacterium]